MATTGQQSETVKHTWAYRLYPESRLMRQRDQKFAALGVVVVEGSSIAFDWLLCTWSPSELVRGDVLAAQRISTY